MLLRRPALHCRTTSRLFHNLRTYQEDKRWPGWQVIIGIETHAQIKSSRKLFSDSFNCSPEQEPNTTVSLFDASFPGTLPRVNPKCVDLALRAAVALKSDISRCSSFDRKHYFYGDLPAGYQITQQYSPIARNGHLSIRVPGAEPFDVRIKQIQLEQDTGKSTSNPRTLSSQVDLNRAGVGLMEIVSEPDMRSPEEAGAYVRTLQSVLRAIGASDGNMEQGSLRCDVNISVNRKGEPPGVRCEIKNVNSIRFIVAAITHEIQRQRNFLVDNPGSLVTQETRGFDEHTFETYRLRSKEDAPDYRYMPDPNLGKLRLSEERIRHIATTLPPLPWNIRARLLEKYPVLEKKAATVDVLLNVDNGKDVAFDGAPSKGAVNYFETVVDTPSTVEGVTRDPILVLNWLTHELLGQLSSRKESFSSNPISPAQFGELVDLVQSGKVTGTSGKALIRHMLAKPSELSTTQLACTLNLLAFSPSSASPTSNSDRLSSSPHVQQPELHGFCQAAVLALPREVAAFKSGSVNVLNKIVGHVMRHSRGRADAQEVKVILERMIKEGDKGEPDVERS